MRNRACSWVLAVCAIAGLSATAVGEPETRHNTLPECFLYRGPQGAAWVGEHLVSLGMIGVVGSPPVYRLAPSLAEKFRPLVNDLKSAPATPQFWFWGLPQAGTPEKPLVLLHLEVESRLVSAETRPGRGGDAQGAEYEVVSAEPVCVEFVPPAWRRAWDDLDTGLRQIVAASRTAPGPQKRERLLQLIEQLSRSLGVMTEARGSAESRTLVRGLAPKARVVRAFQRRAEGEWGGQLRQYAARLRIAPPTLLPPERKACPKRELAVAANSPAEFLAKIRRDWPEDTFDEPLMYSPGLKRTVFVWQVEDVNAQEFEALRTQAREELAREKEEQAKRAAETKPATEPASVAIAPWGVRVRPAGDDLLAEKGLLQGLLVEQVPPDSAVGLRAGDVIIGYESVYDLVMGRFESFGPLQRLRNIASYGGPLDVLRGDQAVRLTIRKP